VTQIHLVPLANAPDLRRLEVLAVALSRTFRTACRIRIADIDISPTLDPSRRQYHSTAILQRLAGTFEPGCRILGVTDYDLFVPVLTFVFGEAQVDGVCAVVSTARLREERYGMPPREDLLRERLLKEAAHELGHTFGLRHCPDWRCVMASSHAVERIDVKGAQFCDQCRRAIG